MRYYKGKYIIVFYDKTDEHFVDEFNNINELIKHRGLEVTRKNYMIVVKAIIRAINRDNNKTLVYDGKHIHCVHLVPMDDYED